MNTAFTCSTLKGKEILAYIEDLLRLRLMLFRDFPMLFNGEFTNHRDYVEDFIQCEHSVMIIVKERQHNQIVGISTAWPLIGEMDKLKAPFIENGLPVSEVFYYRESMILPAYRGVGIGQHFFDEREKMAREHPGIKYLALDGVERADDDPRKPKDYRAPYSLWRRNGFEKRDNLSAIFHWEEVGKAGRSENKVKFWIKELSI